MQLVQKGNISEKIEVIKLAHDIGDPITAIFREWRKNHHCNQYQPFVILTSIISNNNQKQKTKQNKTKQNKTKQKTKNKKQKTKNKKQKTKNKKQKTKNKKQKTKNKKQKTKNKKQ